LRTILNWLRKHCLACDCQCWSWFESARFCRKVKFVLNLSKENKITLLENNLRPIVQLQRTYSRQMSAEVAVNTRAFDANQRTIVQAGPNWVCKW